MRVETLPANAGESASRRTLPPCVALGRSSLAVSPAAASFERREAALAQLIAEFLDRVSPRAARNAVAANQRKALLDIRLCAAFDAIPLEDGIDHPAEHVIREALGSAANSRPVAAVLQELCLDPERPVFGASILRCLGRLPGAGSSEWREQLVRAALGADNPEVRDAAMQAAESWGGSGMATILREHDEPDAFLRQYQRKVTAACDASP